MSCRAVALLASRLVSQSVSVQSGQFPTTSRALSSGLRLLGGWPQRATFGQKALPPAFRRHEREVWLIHHLVLRSMATPPQRDPALPPTSSRHADTNMSTPQRGTDPIRPRVSRPVDRLQLRFFFCPDRGESKSPGPRCPSMGPLNNKARRGGKIILAGLPAYPAR